jgi:hypothetical protein
MRTTYSKEDGVDILWEKMAVWVHQGEKGTYIDELNWSGNRDVAAQTTLSRASVLLNTLFTIMCPP